ncbi:MAG TPA: magnesium-translocating P-type ATPase [Thermodesulfobacteriota bacterium]|nr:magnesium-translocating P-type ATPase [Thermodesulfobacteriota bacterium]
MKADSIGEGGVLEDFWATGEKELVSRLGTSAEGLSSGDAERRLKGAEADGRKAPGMPSWIPLLLSQFNNPIIIILLAAAVLSAFLSGVTDALIILVIVLLSGVLGFWQEHGAAGAVEKLLSMVRVNVRVLRDGEAANVPIAGIVPGDVVLLSAGDMVPGDCRILESRDLFVSEAALTGENYPAEKSVCTLPPGTPLSGRVNCLFMGSSVVSGTARAVVVLTGRGTVFGKISERLKLGPPETEFQHGIRKFGYLLMETTLLLVLAVFAVNVYFDRPVLESFLFSMAIAVGLTPQLLHAVISVNLARGARRMAESSVIVKKLSAIESFGSMNVLCSDKTGTLTKGVIEIHSAVNVLGEKSGKVLLYAYLNACFETGFTNPLDDAIRGCAGIDASPYKKLDEVPYDFSRRMLSVLVSGEEGRIMITKGALASVLSACSKAELPSGGTADIEDLRSAIEERSRDLSSQGFRTIGIACKAGIGGDRIDKSEESGMTFLGFIALYDPPKEGVEATIAELGRLGISLKVVTGDNRDVARFMGTEVGMREPEVVTGGELAGLSSESILAVAARCDIFAEIEPGQKERIVLALKKAGNVVGYIGDGINDTPALHAADVGISVDSAADVARQAADIVLLKKDLGVLVSGVREGRVTFANTLKYVFMATSANFGNMFSVAGASFFLTFLPLLPKQILLTNLMADIPEMTIAGDSVDDEMVMKPRKWDIKFIRNFMAVFGVISSVFDYLTFGILLFMFNAPMEEFRTGWFVESVVSAALVILVIRTRRPFLKSKPGKYLAASILLIACAAVLLPYSPLAGLFGFRPLPWTLLAAIGGIVAVYVVTAEAAKRFFYGRVAR